MEDNSRDQHVLPLGIIGMPLVRLDDGEVDQLAYLPGNDCSPNQLLGGPNPNKADGDVHHWLLHKVTIHNHTPASRLILGGPGHSTECWPSRPYSRLSLYAAK